MAKDIKGAKSASGISNSGGSDEGTLQAVEGMIQAFRDTRAAARDALALANRIQIPGSDQEDNTDDDDTPEPMNQNQTPTQ